MDARTNHANAPQSPPSMSRYARRCHGGALVPPISSHLVRWKDEQISCARHAHRRGSRPAAKLPRSSMALSLFRGAIGREISCAVASKTLDRAAWTGVHGPRRGGRELARMDGRHSSLGGACVYIQINSTNRLVLRIPPSSAEF